MVQKQAVGMFLLSFYLGVSLPFPFITEKIVLDQPEHLRT